MIVCIIYYNERRSDLSDRSDRINERTNCSQAGLKLSSNAPRVVLSSIRSSVCCSSQRVCVCVCVCHWCDKHVECGVQMRRAHCSSTVTTWSSSQAVHWSLRSEWRVVSAVLMVSYRQVEARRERVPRNSPGRGLRRSASPPVSHACCLLTEHDLLSVLQCSNFGLRMHCFATVHCLFNRSRTIALHY